MIREIKFKGKDYILVSTDRIGKSGSITTEHRYKHGYISYAHLDENGDIRCFGETIGDINDVEFGVSIEIPLDPKDTLNMLVNFIEDIDIILKGKNKDRDGMN